MRARVFLIVVPLLVITSAWAVVAFGYTSAQRTERRSERRPTANEEVRAKEPRSAVVSEDQVPAVPSEPRLVYLENGAVHVRSGSDDRVLSELSSSNVFAAPTGEHLALLEGPATADGDFAAIPVLKLVTLEGATVVDAGPGIAPVWSHDGSKVAYLRPVEERECFAEACDGATEVAVASLGGDAMTITSPGSWTILGWLGDRVIVADATAPGSSVAVGPDGTMTDLGIPASTVWDGSPDGDWLVTSGDQGVVFHRSGTSGLTGEKIEIDTDGRPLGEGAWSASGEIVAVALDVSLTKVRSELVSVSPGDTHAVPVPGSKGVMGRPRLDPAGASVAFPALATGTRLEARYCTLGASNSCRTLIPRARDLVLLALR